MAIRWPFPSMSPQHVPLPRLKRLLFALLGMGAHDADDEGQASAPSEPADRVAFEAFFEQYALRISTYLWRMTGDEQYAKDLSQETFLRAWQHFAQIQSYERPEAWLFRVATNLARQLHRRRTGPVETAMPIDEMRDQPMRDLAANYVERDLISSILASLTPRLRAALILREVYGLSCEEIAESLNISREASKMALYRARVQFRETYRQREEQS